jgi:hypothetical protein
MVYSYSILICNYTGSKRKRIIAWTRKVNIENAWNSFFFKLQIVWTFQDRFSTSLSDLTRINKYIFAYLEDFVISLIICFDCVNVNWMRFILFYFMFYAISYLFCFVFLRPVSCVPNKVQVNYCHHLASVVCRL